MEFWPGSFHDKLDHCNHWKTPLRVFPSCNLQLESIVKSSVMNCTFPIVHRTSGFISTITTRWQHIIPHISHISNQLFFVSHPAFLYTEHENGEESSSASLPFKAFSCLVSFLFFTNYKQILQLFVFFIKFEWLIDWGIWKHSNYNIKLITAWILPEWCERTSQPQTLLFLTHPDKAKCNFVYDENYSSN